MAYGLMTDFPYEVGDGVGKFLTEEEKANFIPLSLKDIVLHTFLTNVLRLPDKAPQTRS